MYLSHPPLPPPPSPIPRVSYQVMQVCSTCMYVHIVCMHARFFFFPSPPCCNDDRLRDGRMCSRVCYCSWRLFRASYSGWLTKTQFCRQAYLPACLSAMYRDAQPQAMHNGRSDQIRFTVGSSGVQRVQQRVQNRKSGPTAQVLAGEGGRGGAVPWGGG